MKSKTKACYLLVFICSASAWAAPSAQKAKLQPISVKSACTSDEKWFPENRLSTYLQSRAELSRKNEGAAISSTLRALKAADASRDAHAKLVTSYWLARSSYDLKLLNLARDSFLTILKQPDTIEKFSDGHAIRLAAMQCLAEIHRNYPTFTLDSEGEAKALAFATNPHFSAEDRAIFYDGLGWTLAKKFGTGKISTDELKRLEQEFADSPYHLSMISILKASTEPNEQQLIKNETIFNSPAFALRSETEKNLLRLVFGRAYFDLRKWDKSISYLKQIPNTSNEIAEAFPVIAWAYLNQDKHEEAIGASSNLVLGGLGKTFSPEGYETLVISLFETCNFTESLKTYQHFRKIYGRSYHFLENLEKVNDGYYALLTRYLSQKKKESKVPDRVGTVWSSDPLFLVNQSEINLGIDEATAADHLMKFVAANPVAARSRSWPPFLLSLQGAMHSALLKRPQLIQQIDVALMIRTRAMFAQVVHTAQNLQLLEAESYEALGDKILAENEPKGPKSKVTKKTTKSHSNEAATWDWGTYSAGEDDENGELWEDELGYLKAKIANICR